MKRKVWSDLFWLLIGSLVICIAISGFFGMRRLRRQHALDALKTNNIAAAQEDSLSLPTDQRQLLEGYIAYLQHDYTASLQQRNRLTSWAVLFTPSAGYNLWTLEALIATTGQQVPMYDLTGLQLAALYLQSEVEHDEENTYAKHNLDVVNQLIAQHPDTPEQQQQNQQSGDDQKSSQGQEQDKTGSEEQKQWAGGEENSDNQQQEWSSPSDSSLSDQQRQQLEQYEQYMQQQQQQNQQFFWKEQPSPNSWDPFDMFGMMFGNQGQLQQQVQQTDKDW